MIRAAATLLVSVAILGGCAPEDDTDVPKIGASRVEVERAACVMRGGRFEPGGRPGTLVCYMPTRDGGERCTASTDCDSLCLSRSGTCAPLTPVFGCQEVLNDRGVVQTLCFE